MDRISKSELIKTVAAATNLTKDQVDTAIGYTINTIINAVASGTAVHLGNGFGTFKPHNVNAMVKKNPITQAPINVPAKRVIKFTPSAALKSAVNS